MNKDKARFMYGLLINDRDYLYQQVEDTNRRLDDFGMSLSDVMKAIYELENEYGFNEEDDVE